MTSPDDVTVWLQQLKTGDENAADLLWRRYGDQIQRLARRRIGGASRRVADEEDVAVSAFNSFCQQVTDGQFTELNSREDLWKLLSVIVSRRSAKHVRFFAAAKRGSRMTRGESIFLKSGDQEGMGGLDEVGGNDSGPELEVAMSEICSELLQRLDETQQAIALYRLEGFTNEEIAEKLNMSVRSITRKLALIRKAWSPQGEA